MRFIMIILLALVAAWFLAPSPEQVSKLVPSIDSIAEKAQKYPSNQQGN